MQKLIKKVQKTTHEVRESVRDAFRGVLNLIKSNPPIQQAQVSALADETLQDVELMQHFGFTSVPPAGAEAIIIPIGGRTTHSVIVATEHGDFRINALHSGEVAIYDQSGSHITLKQGKVIEIQCDTLMINAKTKVSFTTPLVETSQVFTAKGQINGNGGMSVKGGAGATFSGNVKQTSGSFSTTGDVTAGSISLKNHRHGDSPSPS